MQTNKQTKERFQNLKKRKNENRNKKQQQNHCFGWAYFFTNEPAALWANN